MHSYKHFLTRLGGRAVSPHDPRPLVNPRFSPARALAEPGAHRNRLHRHQDRRSQAQERHVSLHVRPARRLDARIAPRRCGEVAWGLPL